MSVFTPARKRVVLVEDEQDLQSMYRQRLKGIGLDVVGVEDGLIALELIKKNIPDIVLLDAMIPRLNGFNVCANLKDDQLTKHIPIIFLTALNEPVFRQKAGQCGADAFFVKPLDWTVLENRIQALLAPTT